MHRDSLSLGQWDGYQQVTVMYFTVLHGFTDCVTRPKTVKQ